MGAHDDYGKKIMRAAAGTLYSDWGQSVEIDYRAGLPARIDGTLTNQVAVEIESRTGKQVRGAVLDLICHRYPKKLLVLIPMHMHDPGATADQCRNILEKFVSEENFKVVLLEGTGYETRMEADVTIIRNALSELGVPCATDGEQK